MEQTLTYALLEKLKEDGFTLLFAPGQAVLERKTYLPINVNVDDFLASTSLIDYSADAYLVIDDALSIDDIELNQHVVIQ